MSALTAALPVSPSTASAERGRTVVDKQVIEKIAEQAALEVTDQSEHRRAFAVVPGDGGGRLPVSAQLDGSEAWLSLDVALSYPGPLRAATEALRQHVLARVEHLVGVSVRRVDIRIGWLVDVDQQPRRLS